MLLRGKQGNSDDMLRKVLDELDSLSSAVKSIQDKLYDIEDRLDAVSKPDSDTEINHNEIKSLRAELGRKNQFIEDILTKFITQVTTHPAPTQILNTVDASESTVRSKTMEEYIARKNKEATNAIKLP